MPNCFMSVFLKFFFFFWLHSSDQILLWSLVFLAFVPSCCSCLGWFCQHCCRFVSSFRGLGWLLTLLLQGNLLGMLLWFGTDINFRFTCIWQLEFCKDSIVSLLCVAAVGGKYQSVPDVKQFRMAEVALALFGADKVGAVEMPLLC